MASPNTVECSRKGGIPPDKPARLPVWWYMWYTRYVFTHLVYQHCQPFLKSYISSSIFLETLASVLVIQSLVRQRIQKSKLNRIRMIRGLMESESLGYFACVLQRFVRSRFATMKFFNIIGSIITIQSFVRWHITKTQCENALLRRAEASAVVIQQTWRSHDKSSFYLNTLMGVVAIQKIVRQWISRAKVNNTLTLMRLKTCEGQHFYACLIQSCWRSYFISSQFLYIKTSNRSKNCS